MKGMSKNNPKGMGMSHLAHQHAYGFTAILYTSREHVSKADSMSYLT
jgi:hypothetical protein